MEYPAINLGLETLKAREGQTLNDCDLDEFQFRIDTYRPGIGGSGSFRARRSSLPFRT